MDKQVAGLPYLSVFKFKYFILIKTFYSPLHITIFSCSEFIWILFIYLFIFFLMYVFSKIGLDILFL